MKRGELHWALVPPGHVRDPEISKPKPRPHLIVSTRRAHKTGLVLACPVSTKPPRPRQQDFCVELEEEFIRQAPGDLGGLQLPSWVLVYQLRAMSQARFQSPSRLGTLDAWMMGLVEPYLVEILGLQLS